MQRYIVYCRELLPLSSIEAQLARYRAWDEVPLVGEEGSCEEDEICINGLSRRTGYSAMARCVNKDDFRMMSGDGGDSSVELGNRMASVVLSRYDGSTPLGVGSMEAAYAESGPVPPPKEADFHQPDRTCEDCFELITPRSAPKTDNLKIEASLVTAGAIGGVLWLAVLSG